MQNGTCHPTNRFIPTSRSSPSRGTHTGQFAPRACARACLLGEVCRVLQLQTLDLPSVMRAAQAGRVLSLSPSCCADNERLLSNISVVSAFGFFFCVCLFVLYIRRIASLLPVEKRYTVWLGDIGVICALVLNCHRVNTCGDGGGCYSFQILACLSVVHEESRSEIKALDGS